MITTLKNIFSNYQNKDIKDLDCSFESVNKSQKFLLKYQNDIVGHLSFETNKWVFEYSSWFKSQNELQPLFEFQNLNKVYENKNLWPFFESRIPSNKQPKVQEYFQEHPQDRGNLAKLLEVFGSTSVNNPYKLVLNI